MSARPISTPSRRTIALALTLGATLLALAAGLVPFARRWQAREQEIAVEVQRLARLRGLMAQQQRLERAVAEREAALAGGEFRLTSARTAGLAASELQSLLQDFADQSQVVVSGLDVTGAPDTTSGPLPMLPATLTAIGDIYGVAELLQHIQHGPLLLEIQELQLRPNPALRGGLLQLTVTLRGPYADS